MSVLWVFSHWSTNVLSVLSVLLQCSKCSLSVLSVFSHWSYNVLSVRWVFSQWSYNVLRVLSMILQCSLNVLGVLFQHSVTVPFAFSQLFVGCVKVLTSKHGCLSRHTWLRFCWLLVLNGFIMCWNTVRLCEGGGGEGEECVMTSSCWRPSRGRGLISTQWETESLTCWSLNHLQTQQTNLSVNKELRCFNQTELSSGFSSV